MSKYINKLAMLTFAIFSISCAANNTTKGVKTLTNKRGEIFTFHGDGTASVKGPFHEDLGTHRTNNNDPSEFDKIQFYEEKGKKCVYVGNIGLKGGKMMIFIMDITGQNHVLEVEKDWTIRKVKTQFHDKTNIVLDSSFWIFQGKIMEDDRTLGNYNIQQESTIRIASRFRGGDNSSFSFRLRSLSKKSLDSKRNWNF